MARAERDLGRAEKLIELYGWRTAFRAQGAICFSIILPSALYLLRETPVRGRAALPSAAALAADPGLHAITLQEAMRTLPFWLMVIAYFCGNMCSQTLHVHQVAFLVDHQVAPMIAAGVVSVVGLASIVGKTGSGWLSDRIERELVYVCGIAVLVGAVGALTWVGRHPTWWGPYVYACMLGVGYSVTAALTPAMVADRFQGRHFGAIVGVGLFGSATGSALGPWLAGYLHDRPGSYALPFAIAAAGGVAAGLAAWIARALRRRAAQDQRRAQRLMEVAQNG